MKIAGPVLAALGVLLALDSAQYRQVSMPTTNIQPLDLPVASSAGSETRVVARVQRLLAVPDVTRAGQEDQAAFLAAARSAPDVYVDRIAMGLGDSDYGIRISAAHFIGELGSLAADTRGRLISCASDENLDVRIAVAVSLGKIGGAEDVIDALSRMVADENHYVRAAAARALAWYPTITEGAVTALRAGLSASDSLTRDTCAFALAKHRRADAEVTAAVIDGVSTKDAYWAMAAATAMDPVPDAVISPLIAAINSPRANVRRMALHILARLGARLAEHQTELRAALGVEPEVTIEQMRSMLVELAQADGNER